MVGSQGGGGLLVGPHFGGLDAQDGLARQLGGGDGGLGAGGGRHFDALFALDGGQFTAVAGGDQVGNDLLAGQRGGGLGGCGTSGDEGDGGDDGGKLAHDGLLQLLAGTSCLGSFGHRDRGVH